MAREDVLVHEEEDLGTAMQKLSIPFRELDQLPIDPLYDFADGLKEIIEDSNLLLEDAREFEAAREFETAREFEAARELEDLNHNESINDSTCSKLFGKSSNPRPTVRFAAPKRSRNKRGRPKRVFFKRPAYLFDSNFAITDKSCSHCGARKTPLWRAGPRGAGTLCNACGVRYKTGRLLPEYRPASSPSFKPNVHSNFHRKVLEIRRERNSPP